MIQATWTLGSLPWPPHQSARLLRSWRKATTTAGCLERRVGAWGSPGGSEVRLSMQARQEFDPWVGKIPCRRKQQPTPASLAHYSPWGHIESENDWSDLAGMHARGRLEGPGLCPQWLHYSQGLGGGGDQCGFCRVRKVRRTWRKASRGCSQIKMFCQKVWSGVT